MRKLIPLVIVLFSIQLKAQVVKITLKSGEERTVTITATSATTIFTDAGSVQIPVVKSITFTSINDASPKFQADLTKAGVEILIDGQERISAVPIVAQQQTRTIDQLEESLDKFAMHRGNAKTAQLIGMLAIAGSLVLQSYYNSEYEKKLDDWSQSPSGNMPKAKYVSPIIPSVGLALFTIGIASDLGASKHLKRNR